MYNPIKTYLKHFNDKYSLPEKDYNSIVPVIEYSEGIPKILFQICLKGYPENADHLLSSLDVGLKNNIDNLRNNNPDFKYYLFSDLEAERFILEYYGKEMLNNYYLRIDRHYGAARADFLRYLVLYAWGGCYLDLKSSISCPLSERIDADDDFVVFYWDSIPNGNRYPLIPEELPKGELLTGLLVSAKGHPFMRSVIMQVMQNIDMYNPFTQGTGFTGVQLTTGNTMYSITINDCINKDSSVHYRYGKAFAQFGFSVHFSGTYVAGDYQKKAGLSNYREEWRPVVVCPNQLIRCIDKVYLYLASKLYRLLYKKS